MRIKFSILFLFVALKLSAQEKNPVPIQQSITSNIYRPVTVEFNNERLKQLSVPAGFKIEVFATGVGNPRMMKVMPDGRVYVTDRDNGRLYLLKDNNKDGRADRVDTLMEMEHTHGVDYFNGKLYIVTEKHVYAAELKSDGKLGKTIPIISDLPDAGQHHNRTLKIGPDTMMYISVGSTCNSCLETNNEAATMLIAKPDGTGRRIYSKGLRNTIGFDWHPETRQLWGWDNGTDHLGDDEGREELNQLKDGGDYGWPFIYEKGKFVMHHEPRELTHEQYAAKTLFPDLLYDAHAASMDFIFYTGNTFPASYTNSGFVAMRGSWNRKQLSGSEVLHVRFDKNGKPTSIEKFLTGFIVGQGTARFGRPVGLAQYIDGSLLVTDDVNGIIYRISYK